MVNTQMVMLEIFNYYEGKVANWWFKDGSEWHFFQNGKRHTGYAKDGNGRRYFANVNMQMEYMKVNFLKMV